MKKLVLYFVIPIIYISCVRDRKSNEPIVNYGVYAPSIALSDYCYFKKNSYWVYEDSVSGKIDCTYVTSAQVTTYTVDVSAGKDYTGVFHYYNMYTKDGIGDQRQYEIHDEDAAQRAKCCNSRYDCKVHWNRPAGPIDSMGGSIPGIYFGSYTFMFNDFNNGESGGSGLSGGYGDECWSRGNINSITINSVIYNDVKVFEFYKTGGLSYPYPTSIKNYIVENVGVVKRIDLDSNRTWLLKRYNVIQ